MVEKPLSIFRKRKEQAAPKPPRKQKVTAKRIKKEISRKPPLELSEGLCTTEDKEVLIERDRHGKIISRKVLNIETKEWVDLI